VKFTFVLNQSLFLSIFLYQYLFCQFEKRKNMQEQENKEIAESPDQNQPQKSQWLKYAGRILQIAGFAGLIVTVIVFSQSAGKGGFAGGARFKWIMAVAAIVCYVIGRIMLFIDYRSRR
jgi:hypothetical protein